MQGMTAEPLDLIGADYAVDNREVESAMRSRGRERKSGVLVRMADLVDALLSAA
jgi:hypothetical protein